MSDGRDAPGVQHVGVAEQGKIHALAGDHELALLYYRYAMRTAVESGAPEAFFRHYLECLIESLELIGSYDDVVRYCDQVAAHYSTFETVDETQRAFIAADRATNAQRRAVALLKGGHVDHGRDALAEATALAGAAGVELPLAELLSGWLNRGLHVDAERLVIEQRKLCYFAVTAQTVDRSRAIVLPPQLLSGGLT